MHFYKGMSYEGVLALPLPAFHHLRRCAVLINDGMKKSHGHSTR